jgi:hypothetical protein
MHSMNIEGRSNFVPAIPHFRHVALVTLLGLTVTLASCSFDRASIFASADGQEYKMRLPATTRMATYLGRGPYICSPSGFGHKSRCVARASYN